ncbi:MAG TPA: hemerythrin domain-containing protein [Ideonella sp.]|uniref:hemerythrin domain-containing protein n=1 Tax=Ideonella sp. TaxID=1929293 RepID=UPI002B6D9AFC|nr:hemerythrin domain-containing protein [Ideonella sp.]HSI47292.1 hemerythrin domain-containing protein [Ideonella sp.]
MPLLDWSPMLQLDHPEMDATHQDFIDLLGQTERALTANDKPAALAHWRGLVLHTVGHFGQEDRWMLATGFSPDNCHSRQHAQVLTVLEEVGRLATDLGDFRPMSDCLPGLAQWFAGHVQSMDAALAAHLRALGFDPATGGMVRPPAPDDALVTGCGGSQCTPAPQTVAA